MSRTADPNERFALTYAQWRETFIDVDALNAQHAREVLDLYRTVGVTVQGIEPARIKRCGDDIVKLRKLVKVDVDTSGTQASRTYTALLAERERLSKKLTTLASLCTPRAGTNRIQLACIYTAGYSSTGSPVRYAQGTAEDAAALTNGLGIDVVIEQERIDVEAKQALARASRALGETQRSWADFLVFVMVESEVDAEMLRRRGEELRPWLQRCLKRGTNPRVYQPFLPHGIEAKLGLDHFGNDAHAVIASRV